MSIRVVPPFRFVAGISDVLHVDPEEASLKRLRAIVAGKDSTFPQARAMALLQASDFPNKHRDFAAVLEDENQSSAMRCLVAIYLGKTATPTAMHILIRNSGIRDERILAAVMRALGCIGDRAALDAISQAKRNASGQALEQAEFAQLLIAHREGLDDVELAVTQAVEPLTPALQAGRPFSIARADPVDAEFCLRSLADQPYGIEFSEQAMYQARCGRHLWMILLNRNFAERNSTGKLQHQRAFPGMVALRDAETGLYAPMYLMLTAPAPDRQAVNIRVYGTSGYLAFAGSAMVKDNRADFSIVAVRRAGAFPVKLEGTFEDGRLDIHTALSTPFITSGQREPSELVGPIYQVTPVTSIDYAPASSRPRDSVPRQPGNQ
jgi:hypothetical protein